MRRGGPWQISTIITPYTPGNKVGTWTSPAQREPCVNRIPPENTCFRLNSRGGYLFPRGGDYGGSARRSHSCRNWGGDGRVGQERVSKRENRTENWKPETMSGRQEQSGTDLSWPWGNPPCTHPCLTLPHGKVGLQGFMRIGLVATAYLSLPNVPARMWQREIARRQTSHVRTASPPANNT